VLVWAGITPALFFVRREVCLGLKLVIEVENLCVNEEFVPSPWQGEG
jgi:hypothetical protein